MILCTERPKKCAPDPLLGQAVEIRVGLGDPHAAQHKRATVKIFGLERRFESDRGQNPNGLSRARLPDKSTAGEPEAPLSR